MWWKVVVVVVGFVSQFEPLFFQSAILGTCKENTMPFWVTVQSAPLALKLIANFEMNQPTPFEIFWVTSTYIGNNYL